MTEREDITRRTFLGSLAATSAGLVFGIPELSQAEGSGRYGKLVDTTKCIGCKRCMSACKRWNNLKVDRAEELTDRDTDLTGNTWVVVNFRADRKNKEDRSYIHWACQHCIKPACAGVCPVSAIKKYSYGPVVVNESKCIGCRYCYMACPYKIPRFDFNKRVTRKCTLCYDRLPNVKTACVAACPVEALDSGPKEELSIKAQRRVEEVGGYLLGDDEAGGTDVLTILKASPEDVGLIVAPKKVVNRNIDKARISFSGFSAAAVLVGLLYGYAQSAGGE